MRLESDTVHHVHQYTMKPGGLGGRDPPAMTFYKDVILQMGFCISKMRHVNKRKCKLKNREEMENDEDLVDLCCPR